MVESMRGRTCRKGIRVLDPDVRFLHCWTYSLHFCRRKVYSDHGGVLYWHYCFILTWMIWHKHKNEHTTQQRSQYTHGSISQWGERAAFPRSFGGIGIGISALKWCGFLQFLPTLMSTGNSKTTTVLPIQSSITINRSSWKLSREFMGLPCECHSCSCEIKQKVR